VKDNGDWWKVEARIIKKTSSQLRPARIHGHYSCGGASALPGQVHQLFSLARQVSAKRSLSAEKSLSYIYVNVSYKVFKVECLSVL